MTATIHHLAPDAPEITLRSEHVVTARGPSLRLTPKELAVAAALVAAAPGMVTSRELLGALGYREGCQTNTLSAHIYTLRRKFAPAWVRIAAGDRPGRSYRLEMVVGV